MNFLRILKKMKITHAKTFTKSLRTLNQKQITQTKTRLSAWVADPNTRQLHDHALTGQWINHRSINVGGDLRLIYRYINNNEILVVMVGSHAQLYE